jgi:hypothetical protein
MNKVFQKFISTTTPSVHVLQGELATPHIASAHAYHLVMPCCLDGRCCDAGHLVPQNTATNKTTTAAWSSKHNRGATL